MHGTAKVINARTFRSEKIGRQMQLLRPVTERPKFGSRLGNNGHTEYNSELPRNTKTQPDYQMNHHPLSYPLQPYGISIHYLF